MESRFGESASILYYDTSLAETQSAHGAVLDLIREQGLVYPVTVVNGEPLYEGSVSYPAILRAVQTRLSDSC